jgi:hypothetical protein
MSRCGAVPSSTLKLLRAPSGSEPRAMDSTPGAGRGGGGGGRCSPACRRSCCRPARAAEPPRMLCGWPSNRLAAAATCGGGGSSGGGGGSGGPAVVPAACKTQPHDTSPLQASPARSLLLGSLLLGSLLHRSLLRGPPTLVVIHALDDLERHRLGRLRRELLVHGQRPAAQHIRCPGKKDSGWALERSGPRGRGVARAWVGVCCVGRAAGLAVPECCGAAAAVSCAGLLRDEALVHSEELVAAGEGVGGRDAYFSAGRLGGGTQAALT